MNKQAMRIDQIDWVVRNITIAVERLWGVQFSTDQVSTHESALTRGIVSELRIIQPGFSGTGIALVGSEFPFVRRSGFIPGFAEWEVSRCTGARAVGIGPDREVVRMVSGDDAAAK